MTRRLLLSYLTVTLAVLLVLEVPLGVFFAQRERDRLAADVEHDATVIASLYEDALEQGLPLDPTPALQYEHRTGARVVVVDATGISRVDTEEPVPRDFSTRPEIVTALGGARASGTRRSDTLSTNLLYVAIPVASSGVVHGALRLTLDTAQVEAHVHRFWFGLAGIGAVILAVMAVVGWVVARSVTRPVRELEETAARFAGGDLSVGPVVVGGPPELRALADTMTHMAERLAGLLAEQRAFVADASHQLRTPLTALRLRLENLQSRLGEADAAEIDVAIEETDRLASLVTDLLRLARADQPQEPVVVDLAAVAGERVDTWCAMADLRQVRLRLVGGEAPLPARAAPGAVEQILDNVLDNALAVSPAGGEITVTLLAGDTEHRVTVADQGPGLSDADKQRAPRRFWRGSTSVPGTGLGLAIASALASASRGSLVLEDAPGGGLAVVLTLSAAHGHPVARR